MTFPNLVIAGAPKCGTSSLFNWLVDHPEVCGSTPKEPFFLMDKDHPLRRRDCNVHDHGLDAYASFFRHCAEHHRVVVEATTHYIYQETAPDVLASLPTKPRIVFLLRKPSERILSSFAYSKNNLGRVGGDLSFAEFVRRIRLLSNSGVLDGATGASAYVLAREIQFSRYVDYLPAWRDRFGEDRIRILLFESMRADPKALVQGLCGWLGLDSSFYDDYDFGVRNRTVPIRSHRVHKAARAMAAKVSAGPLKTSLKRLYFALQSKASGGGRSESDEAALAELDEEFRSFNERLAREFGLSLDAWDQDGGKLRPERSSSVR